MRTSVVKNDGTTEAYIVCSAVIGPSQAADLMRALNPALYSRLVGSDPFFPAEIDFQSEWAQYDLTDRLRITRYPLNPELVVHLQELCQELCQEIPVRDPEGVVPIIHPTDEQCSHFYELTGLPCHQLAVGTYV